MLVFSSVLHACIQVRVQGETWDEQLAQIASEIADWPESRPINYDVITRKILMSEPPFATDIEAHAKFCQVWGGGKSQHVVRDICAYIRSCEVSERVPPAYFESARTLKCNVTQMPARFVGACIKLASTRPGKIAARDVKRIATDKKEMVWAAEQYLMRAVELCETVPNTSAIPLGKLRGDFECDIVEYVFDCPITPSDPRSQQDMQSIVQSFVNKLNGESPSAPPCPETNDAINRMFDATSVDAGREQVMASRGISQGTIMQARTSDPFFPHLQFEVNHINDDGSIGFKTINVDGSTATSGNTITTVVMSDLKDYKAVKPTERFTEIPVRPIAFKDFDTVYRMVADWLCTRPTHASIAMFTSS